MVSYFAGFLPGFLVFMFRVCVLPAGFQRYGFAYADAGSVFSFPDGFPTLLFRCGVSVFVINFVKKVMLRCPVNRCAYRVDELASIFSA